ncbi:hypothetical protein NHX12_012288 [Muraenolepis orangiensis]|uniref:Uncharacterized protein n=1 Tax=Muraenolepis orangiensis TaxID=630683 RepID=A0A9Q0I5C5_9TELE|nr:hypothetical protein NHX12_012288 [Muraenolepis orangiensis]
MRHGRSTATLAPTPPSGPQEAAGSRPESTLQYGAGPGAATSAAYNGGVRINGAHLRRRDGRTRAVRLTLATGALLSGYKYQPFSWLMHIKAPAGRGVEASGRRRWRRCRRPQTHVSVCPKGTLS